MFRHRRSGARNSLLAALIACTDAPSKPKASRFLAGLSSDELQFIADFLGSCILESQARCARNRAECAQRIARFQSARANSAAVRSNDLELKMILLLEYLCCAGAQEEPLPAQVAGPGLN